MSMYSLFYNNNILEMCKLSRSYHDNIRNVSVSDSTCCSIVCISSKGIVLQLYSRVVQGNQCLWLDNIIAWVHSDPAYWHFASSFQGIKSWLNSTSHFTTVYETNHCMVALLNDLWWHNSVVQTLIQPFTALKQFEAGSESSYVKLIHG